MKLSITSRLTITSAVLAALVLLPASVALYRSVTARLESESIRSAESAARYLAFMAFYQWDDDLLLEYKARDMPLRDVALKGEHWALVRGGGAVVKASGVLRNVQELKSVVGASAIVEDDADSYRLASAPLLHTPDDTFETLPEAVRDAVKKASPDGRFLAASREGGGVVEVVQLEPDRVLELEVTLEGRIVEGEVERLARIVPPDLVETMGAVGADAVRFKSWLAHRGQLLARVEGEAASGEPFEVVVNRLGERFHVGPDEAEVEPNPDWKLWVVVAIDAEAELLAINNVFFLLATATPLVWGAIVLIGWFVTRRALSPVKRIVDTVERIQVSHLEERLPVGPVRDELGSISATINRMLDRVEEGYRRERQFTGDASHELRGPVAKFIADIDIALSKERDSSEYRETLVRCRAYAVGMQRLVESLLWLARFDSQRTRMQTRAFELTDVIAEVVRVFPQDQAERLRLDLNGGGAIHVLGDPELIQVMVQNLVQNALRYSAAASPVGIALASHNGVATVEVRDRGEGIPDDLLRRVFSRFYRVDKSRSRGTGGSGLGLAIVEEIARAHEFDVVLRNLPGGGLVARFSLNVAPAA